MKKLLKTIWFEDQNKLSLSFWKIRLTILKELMMSLVGNEDIRDLSLWGLSFDRTAITYLSEYVSTNFNLTKVNLSWSQMKNPCLAIFLKYIRDTYHIEYLNIAAIPFEEGKEQELTKWLKIHISTSTSLIHLDISSWNLNSHKLGLIAEGIQESKSLKSVHLSGNDLLPEDISKLVTILGGETPAPNISSIVSKVIH